MDILPVEINEIIFLYIPLVTNKYLFKNLNKIKYKNLNIKFYLYIASFRNKNKEWLLIEFLIKDDYLAIYYIINDLPKKILINLIKYSIKTNKIHIIKIILSHHIGPYLLHNLQYNYSDETLKKIFNIYKVKYLTL